MATDSPVLKVGAVVLRAVASRQSSVASKEVEASAHDVLILQPIPKKPGEVPHFVLARGSRQYQDATGEWHDARDAATGAKYAASLEPFERALAREIEEEAGVSPEALARAQVTALGVMEFQSRTKGVYPIYWFVVVLAAADAASLTDTVPVDAMALRWASLAEIQAMAAVGDFSAGYVPVIEAALHALQTNP